MFENTYIASGMESYVCRSRNKILCFTGDDLGYMGVYYSLSFLFATAVLPMRGPNRVSMNLVGSNQIFGELFAETPLLYLMLWSLVIFSFCGSMTLVALFVSLYIKNTFVIMITPFTVYLGADVVARHMAAAQADAFLPMQFLHPRQWMPGRPDIVFAELGMLLLVGVLFYVIAMRRDTL